MVLNIRRLTPDDVSLMEGLLRAFGEAFNDVETYTATRQVRTILGVCSAATLSLRLPP
jgi:hypothetical protein